MANWTKLGSACGRSLLNDQSGRTAVSYAVVSCLLGVVAVVAIGIFSGAVQPR